MKKFALMTAIVCALLLQTACTKMEICSENILGTWVEDYADYPYYAPEGYATYTFRDDHRVDIHYYDVFAGEHDVNKSYFVGGDYAEDKRDKEGYDMIYFNLEKSDMSGEEYQIVKLTKNEMKWQRRGTTFSKGTVGSDFKHFLRKE